MTNELTLQCKRQQQAAAAVTAANNKHGVENFATNQNLNSAKCPTNHRNKLPLVTPASTANNPLLRGFCKIE